jgi:hypothetical protein
MVPEPQASKLRELVAMGAFGVGVLLTDGDTRRDVAGGVVRGPPRPRCQLRTSSCRCLGTNHELVPKPTPIGPDLA